MELEQQQEIERLADEIARITLRNEGEILADLHKLVERLKKKDRNLPDMPEWEARFGYGYAYRELERLIGGQDGI